MDRLSGRAPATRRILTAMLIMALVAGAASHATAEPSCPQRVPLEEARRSSNVFEGILIDEWSEPVLFDGRIRALRTYHDSPAHQSAPPCYPGAAGEAVQALSAHLGPPKAVFDGPLPPPVAFWVPLARRARSYVRLAIQFVDRALADR